MSGLNIGWVGRANMQLKITQGSIYRAQNTVQSNLQVDAQKELSQRTLSLQSILDA